MTEAGDGKALQSALLQTALMGLVLHDCVLWQIQNPLECVPTITQTFTLFSDRAKRLRHLHLETTGM